MKYLAIDLGSSSARIMLAEKENQNITLTEIARFPHCAALDNAGHYRWDIDHLFGNIVEQIKKTLEIDKIASIGIGCWGVDYGGIGKTAN